MQSSGYNRRQMHTRRQFLASAAALQTGLPRAARPNILVIITDQQQAGMMSCAGHRYVKTPNLDSLAQTGVRFERAYVTNPVCSPSRLSLMTGHMPSAIGMECNEDGYKPVPAAMLRTSMGTIFRDAGYRTVYGGKVHLPAPEGGKRGEDQIGAFGFEFLSKDQRGDLATSCAGFLREKHERPFLMVASFINPHDICYMAISAFAKASGQDTAAVTKGQPAAAATKGQAAAAVSKKQSRPDSPAAYLANALRTPEGISEDEFFRSYCPPLPANQEPSKDELSSFMVDKRAFQRYVREKWTDRDWRLHRWAYTRLTEHVDGEIGVVLKALRESGRDKDTLVVMTSDHGDQDGAHRLEHKEVLYEEAIRVPFIVSYKGVTKAGTVDRQHLVSNGLDLIPTLCDFAGIKTPASLHGHSVRPLAVGEPVRGWRECVVVENHLARLVHGGDWKYLVGRNAKHADGACGICPARIKDKDWDGKIREMVIDLKTDPGEMVNLAKEQRGQSRLNEGRKLLPQWCRQNGVSLDDAYVVPGTSKRG
jgi:arylsulfatase A-like enzyme